MEKFVIALVFCTLGFMFCLVDLDSFPVWVFLLGLVTFLTSLFSAVYYGVMEFAGPSTYWEQNPAYRD